MNPTEDSIQSIVSSKMYKSYYRVEKQVQLNHE